MVEEYKNGTLGTPIRFINQVLYPNYELNYVANEFKSNETIKLLTEILNAPEPPSYFYSIQSATFQNFQGQKILQVLMSDINASDTVTNLFYFTRSVVDPSEILILDAVKTTTVGFLRQKLKLPTSVCAEGIQLTDQWYGLLYAVGQAPTVNDQGEAVVENIFTALQFFIDLAADGTIQSVLTGYPIPIYKEQYGETVTRTSFTASFVTLVGLDFDTVVNQGFDNAVTVDINYQPTARAVTTTLVQ